MAAVLGLVLVFFAGPTSSQMVQSRLRSGIVGPVRAARPSILARKHSLSRRLSSRPINQRPSRREPCRSADISGAVISAEDAGIISISPSAGKRIAEIKASREGDLYLRMGVKSGGCSGMSYVMEMIEPGAISEDDTVVAYDGFNCVIDPSSMLYLFGMTLDFSNELIGGGFKFFNPNAKDTCGCGSSFGA
ncbi:hypothetical protein AAMO2058_000751600 [Amorphochlora amoebiformis]